MQDKSFFARSDFRFGILNMGQSILLAVIEIVGIISCISLLNHLIRNGFKNINIMSVIVSSTIIALSISILVYVILFYIKGKIFLNQAKKIIEDANIVHQDASFAEKEMILNKRSFEMQIASQRSDSNQPGFKSYGMSEKINSLKRDYEGGAQIEWDVAEIDKGEAIYQIERYMNMYALGHEVPKGIFNQWSTFSNMPDKDLCLICKDMVDVLNGKRRISTLQNRLAKIRKKWEKTGK